jgi:outer membrane lipopolysaccharide assembly protein LptE/RlpB
MIITARTSCVAAALAAMALLMAGCDRHAPDGTVLPAIGGGAGSIAGKADASPIGTDVSIEDAELTAKVRAALSSEPSLQSQRIDVDTQDAVVTLEGTVESSAMRDRAIAIAGAVNGVVEVRDKLDAGS